MRARHATLADVEFHNFIVCEDEKAYFTDILRKQKGTPVEISYALKTTALTLFDMFAVRRLQEYYDAMQRPSTHKFFFRNGENPFPF